MIRKFKALGLVLAAMFAMSALAASAASAAEFHSEKAPATLSGTQTTGHVFTTSAGKVTCTVATFSGTTSAVTQESVTVTPKYEKCTAFGFINVPIHVNGCSYTFTNTASGHVHVACPGTSKIEITTPGCTTTVGPQTLTSNTYTNAGAGNAREVNVDTNVANIEYNECGTVRKNGTYTGTTTVTAKDSGGNANGIWYS